MGFEFLDVGLDVGVPLSPPPPAVLVARHFPLRVRRHAQFWRFVGNLHFAA